MLELMRRSEERDWWTRQPGCPAVGQLDRLRGQDRQNARRDLNEERLPREPRPDARLDVGCVGLDTSMKGGSRGNRDSKTLPARQVGKR